MLMLPNENNIKPSSIDKLNKASNFQNTLVLGLKSLLIAFYIYLLINYLLDPIYTNIFDGINLGIHEAGHLLFIFFGETTHVWGGTLLQTLVPIFAGLHLYLKKDLFGVYFTTVWLGTSLIGISVYMKDAVTMSLPLVSVGFSGDPIHDWNYIFTETELLNYSQEISSLTRVVGLLTISLAIYLSCKHIYNCIFNTNPLSKNSETQL